MVDPRVESLIVENSRTRAPYLDLGNCALRTIPEEIWDHVWLRELSFASEWWDIGPSGNYRTSCQSLNAEDPNTISTIQQGISKLVNLQKLWLNGTADTSMPLASIEALADLEQLEVLGLSHSKIGNLAPLSRFTHLRLLDLQSCRSLKDITPLSNVASLKFLDLHGTSTKELSPLEKLASLEFLDLCKAPVRNLTPILPILERGIDIFDEEPNEEATQGVFVARCPLSMPPPEIVAGGATSVRLFFDETKAQGVDHLYEAKVLIVGEGGAGKTSLLRRLFRPKDPLPEESETTKGIAIYKHQFGLPNGRKYRLNVWDFGGQEIYHATHQFFLTRRSLYILVDDTRRDNKSVYDEGFKYWLEVIDALSGHSPVLIYQNEKGGRSKAIDESGIRASFTNVKEFFHGDLIHRDAAQGLKKAIEYEVQRLSHVGEELPAKWLHIRADIEKEAKTHPYISEARYLEIYSQHLERSKSKALHLSRYLHDLGVYLHFQEDRLLRRTIILQNQWCTEAVFLVVDNNIVKSRFGRFTEEDCVRIWSSEIYREMHPELLALMQKFELCYPLPDSVPETWLIPQLLSPSRPDALKGWERSDDLTLRYLYEFLPKGVINRLMVRQHRYVKRSDLAWTSGALFEEGETSVLVILLPTGNEIFLRAKGPDRKELLAIIASDLDALNATFHGVTDRVKKFVPCCCAQCGLSRNPEYFDLRRLRQRKKDQRLQIECGSSYLSVDVNDLLDGVLAGTTRNQPGKAHVPVPQSIEAVRTRDRIDVFLASSLGLKEQRDILDLFLRRLSELLPSSTRKFEVTRAETFDHSVTGGGAQSRLNSAVSQADIFLCILADSVGMHTEAEFDTAYASFMKTGKPLVYLYFQSFNVVTGSLNENRMDSLLSFRKKITGLGHYVFDYESIDALKDGLINACAA